MAEQTVTLNPSESKVVVFEATPQEAKTYLVSVNGLAGSFVAKLPPAPVVEIIRPIGNVDCGFHVWCENCLIGGYNLIDDPGDYRSHDGDATYIRAEGTGRRAWCKSFRMSNLIESGVKINKIVIHTVDKGFTWDHHTMIFTRHNNTDYMVDLTSWWVGPWTHHSLELTTNPGTGLAWTEAEINALIVGLATYRKTGGGLGGAYTQMYVEVNYTPAF